MSTTEGTPTYLDQLSNEALNIICDYIISEDKCHSYEHSPNPVFNLYGLQYAWPHSRYQALTKSHMYHSIRFNGSASKLSDIMNGFLLRPETRLQAQVLIFNIKEIPSHEYIPSPFGSIRKEFEWMAKMCTKLGLKIEDMDLPVISQDPSKLLDSEDGTFVTSQDGIPEEFRPGIESDITWQYKRLEFLAQILPKVTKFYYYTDRKWIWPFPTSYKKDLRTRALPAVALESQSEDNNIKTEPASRTITTPVPCALRSVDQYHIGDAFLRTECQNPYQTLLPAFFLPNIRIIHCSNIFGDENLTPLGPDAPHPHTSPITTLHIMQSNMRPETFEKFLRLPKALVDYSYSNKDYAIMNGCTMSEMVKLLSKYQSKSLEILTLDGTETGEVFAESASSRDEDYFAPKRIGSLRHFVKLRVIQAPYWSLVSSPDSDISLADDVLPQSLEIIKLSLKELQEQWLGHLLPQLECLIKKKRERYPRLARVEVDMRPIRLEESNLLCRSSRDSLALLATKENVQLIFY